MGNHADEPRHGANDSVAYAAVRVELAVQQQGPHREDGPGHVAQDSVDAVHELGPRQSEAPGLNRQLARIGVCAHRGGLVAPCAGNHEASGEDLLTGTLVRRLGLPGEKGFVDLETGRCSHHAVGHDLVTRAEADEVVEDHCFDRDVEFDPIAHDVGAGEH